MINFRSTNRLHYLNSSIEVVQSLPAGADDWFLAGGAPMPVAVYNVREGGGLPESYINVVNPGVFDAAPGIAPTWSGVTGWGYPGATSATGLLVPYSFADTNLAIAIRLTVSGAGLSNAGRAFSSNAETVMMLPNNSGINKAWLNGGSFTSAGPLLGNYVVAIGGKTAYLDGVAVGTISAGGVGAGNLAIGNRPALDRALHGNIQYLAVWDTDTDHATWIPQVSAAVALL